MISDTRFGISFPRGPVLGLDHRRQPEVARSSSSNNNSNSNSNNNRWS
jgi:hypothetical protein